MSAVGTIWLPWPLIHYDPSIVDTDWVRDPGALEEPLWNSHRSHSR